MASTGDWQLKPILFDEASNREPLKKSDYTIAVDETGTASPPKNSKDFNHQWFSLTTLFFLNSNLGHGKNLFSELQKKYWPREFNGHPVVLHSRDIRKRIGPFNPKVIDYSQFLEDLNDSLKRSEFRISSVSLDKIAQLRQYSIVFNPYQWCTMTTIERIVMFLENSHARGRVIFESRGDHEDQFLLNYINSLFEKGTKYMAASRIRHRIVGVYFERKVASDSKRMMWPLQISDIISYRIHHFVKSEEFTDEINTIWDKMYGYPDHVFGRGLKIFPGGKNNDI